MICSAGLSCLCACFNLQVNFFKTADPAMRLRNRVLVIQQFAQPVSFIAPTWSWHVTAVLVEVGRSCGVCARWNWRWPAPLAC
jgi:hypothetical protein